MIKSVVGNFHGDAGDLKLPKTADDCSVPLMSDAMAINRTAWARCR